MVRVMPSVLFCKESSNEITNSMPDMFILAIFFNKKGALKFSNFFFSKRSFKIEFQFPFFRVNKYSIKFSILIDLVVTFWFKTEQLIHYSQTC